MTTPDPGRTNTDGTGHTAGSGLRRNTWFLLGGLLLSLLLAGLVSNFASGSPDGLDSTSTKGCTTDAEGEIIGGACMASNAKEHELGDSPLADYGLRGVDNQYLSTAVAGTAGVLVTFAIAGGLFWLARTRRPAAAPAGRAAGAAGAAGGRGAAAGSGPAAGTGGGAAAGRG